MTPDEEARRLVRLQRTASPDLSGGGEIPQRLADEVERLLAENERMRRALEAIRAEAADTHTDRYGDDQLSESQIEHIGELVNAALGAPTPDPKPKVHRSLLTHAVYAVDPTKIEDRCVCENCSKTGTMRALMEDPEPCLAMVRRYRANADDSVPKGCTQDTTDGQGGEK